jgi:predicted  nucleic acid-binding Zn-ribbon protein
MIAKCPCDNCGENIEFATEEFLSGSSIACPHCGKETFLSVSPNIKPAASSLPKLSSSKPIEPTVSSPQKFTAPVRAKIPTVVWIGTGIFVLCALCFASILIGKNLQKHSDQTSGTKSDAPLFLQNLNEKSAANKKDYPSPPSNGMEFTANILNDFPERVEGPPGTLEGKSGWLDGEFSEISNDEFGLYYLDFDTSTMVGFTVNDKNGNSFNRCYAEKSKFGDLLLGLKYGDRIRISGQAMMARELNTDATFDIFLRVDSIQVIK